MIEGFGVLTLAIEKDYKKAIALSFTLKECSPGVPMSIVCPKSLVNKVKPYFDKVIIENEDLKGFIHKLYLDKYSPYEKTLFLDSDILIIKDILPRIKEWEGSSYAATGRFIKDTVSTFGLDRSKVLALHNLENFSSIDGAGHAYFEKPQCYEVFNKSREIILTYEKYETKAFADEDVMGIALSLLDIAPQQNDQFLGSPWCAIENSFKIDTSNSYCEYEDSLYGTVNPTIVQFPHFAKPIEYAREIRKICKRNGVKVRGLMKGAIKEVYTIKVNWALRKFIKRKMNLLLKTQ